MHAAAAEPVADRGRTGTFEDRYELEERIGAGGMGEVYRARDVVLRRTVALKLMRPRLAGDPESKQRFLREARAAAALDHSVIAPIYDAGESADGTRYMAMPYYTSESLAERLRHGPVRPGRAIAIARKLAEAVAYAHDHGVVHRDLKPGNVLLTDEGEVKLIDFGVAKVAESTQLTRSGAVMGTPAYMAPEQVKGEPTDERTDVWALGVMLFEMLTGHRPFEAEDPQAVLFAIVQSPPHELVLESGEGTELRAVLRKALAKAPEDRYQSAAEMAVALEQLSEQFPSTVDTLSYHLQPPKRAAGRRWWPWLAGAGLVLVAVLAVWLARAGPGPRPAPVTGPGAAVAVLPFENLTGQTQLGYVGIGIASGLISQLSEMPGINVVSRSRAWAAEEGLSPAELAEALAINVLVEGEVHDQGGGLRVDVAVSDPSSALVLWSEQFQGTAEDLYGLQQGIVQAVARVLSVPLSPEDRRRLARGGPPADAFHHYLLGLERLERTDNPRHAQFAADHFRQAIARQGDFAVFHAALARAISQQRLAGLESADLDEAERAARRALELDPDLADAHLALARTLRVRGRYAESIAEMIPLLDDHPKPDEACRELAFAYQLAGDSEAAAELFRRAVSLGGENWFNWNALGVFQAESGQVDEAKASLEKAVALAPESATWPLLNLGGVKLLLQDYEGAIADFEAADSTTSDPDLASNLGTAYYFLGRYDRAEEVYAEAIAMSKQPNMFLLHRNRGDALLQLGRNEEALAEYRQALELVERALADKPRDSALLRRRFLYAAKAGDCAAALSQAGSFRPVVAADDWQSHLNLAMTFSLCDRRDEAMEEVSALVEIGLPGAVLRQQDELEALHDDPEFLAITEPAEGAAGTGS